MKQSLFYGAFLLASAFASPVGRREIVVDLTVVTKTVTVTAQLPQQTPPPPPPPPPPSNKPEDPKEPEEPEEPKEPERPKEPEQPKEPENHPPPPPPPADQQPEKPEKPEKPEEPEKPKQPEQPKEPEKPEKPEEPEKPKEPENPPPPPPVEGGPPPSDKPTTPPSNPGNDYQSIVLHHHNIHRANHSAADLTWSKDLEGTAKQLAESCVYDHNTQYSTGSYGGGGSQYGQNMGYQSKPGDVASMITNLMYNGEEPLFQDFYGIEQPDNSQFTGWGHFTQIVWQKTTEVGCVTHTCPTLQVPGGSSVQNADFTVCNYGPPGNYANEYAANVKKPLGHPTVTV